MSLRLKFAATGTARVCYYLDNYCYVMKLRKIQTLAVLSDINHKTGPFSFYGNLLKCSQCLCFYLHSPMHSCFPKLTPWPFIL